MRMRCAIVLLCKQVHVYRRRLVWPAHVPPECRIGKGKGIEYNDAHRLPTLTRIGGVLHSNAERDGSRGAAEGKVEREVRARRDNLMQRYLKHAPLGAKGSRGARAKQINFAVRDSDKAGQLAAAVVEVNFQHIRCGVIWGQG